MDLTKGSVNRSEPLSDLKEQGDQKVTLNHMENTPLSFMKFCSIS